MNYINRLQNELEAEKRELTGLKTGLAELQAYLLSGKFGWPADSVNIQDVLNRLRDADAAGLAAREAIPA